MWERKYRAHFETNDANNAAEMLFERPKYVGNFYINVKVEGGRFTAKISLSSAERFSLEEISLSIFHVQALCSAQRINNSWLGVPPQKYVFVDAKQCFFFFIDPDLSRR